MEGLARPHYGIIGTPQVWCAPDTESPGLASSTRRGRLQ